MASSGMPWIKLYNEFLDDPKIGQLPEALQLLFIKLLLIAGECDAEGALVNGVDSLSAADIAWRLRLDEKDVALDMAALIAAGLLCVQDDNTITVTNFSKRQGRPQSVKREQWRDRQRRKRDGETGEESVTGDAKVSHAPIAEERRGEQSRVEGEQSRVVVADSPLQALLDIGMDEDIARKLADDCDASSILGWCNELAKRLRAGKKIDNPPGWVRGMLKRGIPPPVPSEDEVWYTKDEYERHIKGGVNDGAL